ncbi:MAG: hypothetical protein JWL90_2018 [Chthoniobacteraceae bacterium]|nr:hypothetical protein [Chthoniobacteraceae bacterium]
MALDTIFADGNFVIVQIGSYIGDSINDPLFESIRTQLKKGRGRLICVEPVKKHFDALIQNYENVPNVIFENVAIADRSGPATFYRLGVDPVEHGYPEWLLQLGSLKKDRMESLWDRYEGDQKLKTFYLQHRIEESITCITFSELLERHNIKSVDLLQIDTEGYELEILSTVDFSAIPVRFINYECVLLHERKQDAERLLQLNGYTLMDHGQDTFCYKQGDQPLPLKSRSATARNETEVDP